MRVHVHISQSDALLVAECVDTSELVAQTQLEAQTAEISSVKVKKAC